jgi:hypothetical protein
MSKKRLRTIKALTLDRRGLLWLCLILVSSVGAYLLARYVSGEPVEKPDGIRIAVEWNKGNVPEGNEELPVFLFEDPHHEDYVTARFEFHRIRDNWPIVLLSDLRSAKPCTTEYQPQTRKVHDRIDVEKTEVSSPDREFFSAHIYKVSVINPASDTDDMFIDCQLGIQPGHISFTERRLRVHGAGGAYIPGGPPRQSVLDFFVFEHQYSSSFHVIEGGQVARSGVFQLDDSSAMVDWQEESRVSSWSSSEESWASQERV